MQQKNTLFGFLHQLTDWRFVARLGRMTFKHGYWLHTLHLDASIWMNIRRPRRVLVGKLGGSSSLMVPYSIGHIIYVSLNEDVYLQMYCNRNQNISESNLVEPWWSQIVRSVWMRWCVCSRLQSLESRPFQKQLLQCFNKVKKHSANAGTLLSFFIDLSTLTLRIVNSHKQQRFPKHHGRWRWIQRRWFLISFCW